MGIIQKKFHSTSKIKMVAIAITMKKLLVLVILLSVFACTSPSTLQSVKVVEIGEEVLKVQIPDKRNNVTYFVKKNSLPVKVGETIQVRNADITPYVTFKKPISNANIPISLE